MLIILGSCKKPAPGPEHHPETKTMELVFSDSLSPQTARFFVAQGWTGGMGEPALDRPDGRPLSFQSMPVYLTSDAEKKVMAQVEMPACIRGEPVIYVHAKISLEKRKERNYSIPGAPEKSYAALDILELYNVTFEAEECE